MRRAFTSDTPFCDLPLWAAALIVVIFAGTLVVILAVLPWVAAGGWWCVCSFVGYCEWAWKYTWYVLPNPLRCVP